MINYTEHKIPKNYTPVETNKYIKLQLHLLWANDTGKFTLVSVVSLSVVSLSVVSVRQIFSETAHWNFLIFCMNPSLWKVKITVSIFGGKFKK